MKILKYLLLTVMLLGISQINDLKANTDTNAKASLNIITSINHVSCYGMSDGSISLNISGGLMPYNINWFGQNPNALGPGNYIVRVSDMGGNDTIISFVIGSPSILNVVSTPTDASCYASNDGRALLSISGGTAPYNTNWNGANPNALIAGTYTVYVIDNKMCTDSNTFTINQPTAMNIALAVSPTTCYNTNDGSAIVAASGGRPPYIYDWHGADSTALYPGNYILTITDDNRCDTNINIAVTSPPSYTISSTITQPTCYGGNDGTASISISGGNPPYTVNWFGVNQSQLAAGIYPVLISDALSCDSMHLIYVTQPEPLQIIPNITNVSCNGGNDGSVTLIIIGGTAPYTQNWFGQNPMALTAGSYPVQITDYNGCDTAIVVLITEATPLSVNVTTTDVDCFGGNDGTAVINISGGSSPYQEFWAGSNPNALLAGSYNIIISDTNNCIDTASFVINEPPELFIEVVSRTNASCYNSNDGTVTINYSGGTPPLTVNYNGANTNNLTAGTYTFSVSDINGCNDSVTFNILSPPPFNVVLLVQDPSCEGLSNGSVSLTCSGSNTPPYFLNWNGIDTTSLGMGSYQVIIQDTTGCDTTVSFFVNDGPSLDITIIEQLDPTCYGGSNGYIEIQADSLNPNVLFDWGSGYDYSYIDDLSAGTYTVTVSEGDDCTTTHTFELNNPPQLEIDFNVQCARCPDSYDGQVQLYLHGNDPFYVDWFNYRGEFTNIDPNITYRDSMVQGTYPVFVYDSAGCADTAYISMCVDNESCLIIPNGFTPNFDGLNDSWYIGLIETYPNATIEVFNRWGQLLYYSTSANYEPWNGFWNGKVAPTADYYYIINPMNGKKPMSGWITLKGIK